MKRLLIILFALAFLPVTLHQIRAEDKPEGVKLLSSHETIAAFTGSSFRTCRHHTANCPDKCHHAGSVVSFSVKEYLNYVKPGKYGDPKAEKFQVMVEDQLGTVKVDKATLAKIKALKSGDTVKLSWNHNYVTKGGSSFPVRTITKLEVVKKSE
ncbi:MAG: hypothetical protein ABGY95_01495 [Rubritalea sp.]|uniref:hypothetical protein n=1 Tax=Rubritalea sp. TaxID=2109375 RepID=UPI003242EE24